MVGQCFSKGLLTGRHLTVDSTYVKANASFKSPEPIVVEMNSKEYIEIDWSKRILWQRSHASLERTILTGNKR
jgi:hypothetical protein